MSATGVEEPRAIAVPGGPRLEGLLRRPREGARAGVVVAHPHPLQGGDKDNSVVRALADAIGTRDLAVLRFDFRHARSRGDARSDADLMRDTEEDLAAAVANLRTALPESAPLALVGYSFGGIAALRVAARVSAAAVAVVGLPARGALGKLVPSPAPAAPTLVVQGAYDEVGSPDDARALMPDADVRPVPNASHGYFGEAGFVARIVAGFVAKRLA